MTHLSQCWSIKGSLPVTYPPLARFYANSWASVDTLGRNNSWWRPSSTLIHWLIMFNWNFEQDELIVCVGSDPLHDLAFWMVWGCYSHSWYIPWLFSQTEPVLPFPSLTEAPAKTLQAHGKALQAELRCDPALALHHSTTSVLKGNLKNASRKYKTTVHRFGMALKLRLVLPSRFRILF